MPAGRRRWRLSPIPVALVDHIQPRGVELHVAIAFGHQHCVESAAGEQRPFDRPCRSARMHQLLDSGGDGSRGAGPKNAIIAVSNIPGKFRNPYRRYRNLYVILESDWSEYLGTVGVKGSYIVIVDRTKLRFPFLLEYLQTASWARRVYRENSIDIFEILESHRTGSLLPSPCNVLDTLRDDLRWLREEYPEEYRLMKRVLEEDKCGVDLARTPYLFDN